MDNTIKSIFHEINTLEDLQKFASDSKDGETPWLEFKAIKRENDKQNDSLLLLHQKSILAKEISAFLNTNDPTITNLQ